MMITYMTMSLKANAMTYNYHNEDYSMCTTPKKSYKLIIIINTTHTTFVLVDLYPKVGLIPYTIISLELQVCEC